jgi:sigma-B regulation protein RsbU (phosphoserine phosphatase)
MPPGADAGTGHPPSRADDIAAARDIQMSILPPAMPAVPGYDLYGCLRPARETGGDMFDLVSLEQGVFILLGDATGHGFGPALCATQMQAMFRVAFRLGAALEEAYVHVNNQLDEDLPDDRFVTAFAGFLDSRRHVIRYFSAGQGPLLHYRAAQRRCDWHGPTTFPLGTLAVAEPGPSHSLTLAPGDVLAVLSDGVYEYGGLEGAFGRDRVAALLRQHGAGAMEALAGQLLGELEAFGGTGPQQDDLTVVLVKRNAAVV